MELNQTPKSPVPATNQSPLSDGIAETVTVHVTPSESSSKPVVPLASSEPDTITPSLPSEPEVQELEAADTATTEPALVNLDAPKDGVASAVVVDSIVSNFEPESAPDSTGENVAPKTDTIVPLTSNPALQTVTNRTETADATAVTEPTPHVVTPAAVAEAAAALPEPIAMPMPAAYTSPSTGAAPAIVVGSDVTGPQAVVGAVSVGGGLAAPVQSAKPKSKKKLWMLSGGLAAIILLGTGAVFGLYLPNTPNHVWNTGINRTGSAINGVITTATASDKLAQYKTTSITGSVAAKVGGQAYGGDFNTNFDKTSLTSGLNVKIGAGSGNVQVLSAKVLSQIPSGSAYPNIFFQVTGIKALQLDNYLPGISSLDGQWIEASSDYIKSAGSAFLDTGTTSAGQISASEIADIARTASGVTQQYLFSTSKDKGVFEQQSFVGKDKLDGLTAYHYKVSVNTAHAKAYCVALTNAVLATDGYKKISGDTADAIAEQKKAATTDCASSVDNTVKASDRFDLWIDGKYKLIYKFRAYDKTDTSGGTYTEVGQIYKGGDDLSFFGNYHNESGKVDGKITFNTNTKTNASKAVLTVNGADSSDPYSFSLTLNANESAIAVKITPPTGALQLQDVLAKFGLGSATGSTDDNSSASIAPAAADSKRKTDIAAVQARLESYYASNSTYPTLADLNSASWRSTNLKGFDSTALQDPNGTSPTLVVGSTPGTNYYSYAVTGSAGTLAAPVACSDAANSANPCTNFGIYAQLTTGSTYSRESNN